MQVPPGHGPTVVRPYRRLRLKLMLVASWKYRTGTGHVAEAEAEVDRLHQELRVEDEVVGVALERDRFQHFAAVDAEAAVEVAEVLAEGHVLERRQGAVGEVLPPRHAAGQGLVPRPDPAAQDHVADAQLDDADGVRDHPAVVLVVRVDHHDDVGPVLQGVAVAGLLVAAVAAVLRVLNDRQAHLAGDLDGAVRAAVVHQEDLVDRPDGNVGEGGGQGALGVVGRQHGDDLVVAARQVGFRHEDALDVEDLVAGLAAAGGGAGWS